MSTAKSISNTTILKKTFPVIGMSCAGCASSVESILHQKTGVETASVNFASNSVLIEYEPHLAETDLQDALQAVGFDLIVNTKNPNQEQETRQADHYKSLRYRTFWSAALTLPVFILGMFYMDWEFSKWISLLLTIPVLTWFGRDFFINAYKHATHGQSNMDTLVALSTSIAFLFSLFNSLYPSYWTDQGLDAHVYYESVTVIITFILLGKLLEEGAKAKTSSAIRKLMDLQPKTLKVLVNGDEVEKPIESVERGDIILIKPGEKIPVDGIVAAGHSFVDESMINGEPVAVKKMKDQQVFAGTINQHGSFQFQAEKVGEDTLLAQIIHQVREAQGTKAPIQKQVDTIASFFVPSIMGLALFTFIIWMIVGGELASTHAILTSVTVLVIACPCALGLATPTAIMVGVGKGAENNILIKDAESLELAHRVDAIVLDKTGTITQGRPLVTDTYWAVDELKTFNAILLAIESQSEHPLAEAVVRKLKSKGIQPAEITDFTSITGKGVQATDLRGTTFYVGNEQLLRDQNININPEIGERAAQFQYDAKTVIYFASQERILAIFVISDHIKPSAKGAVRGLQEKGLKVYMLTGDNEQTAKVIAREAGIVEYQSEMLPGDKAAFIADLQQEGRTVAMVGDGINDAQALAQADVSIAMGKGSDIAMDVAKMTLITSDLQAIPKALELSKRTVNGIHQNLFWAFIYNAVAIPIAAGVLYPINGFLLDPMIAGGAMAFSSLSVLANSLRLKAKKLKVTSTT